MKKASIISKQGKPDLGKVVVQVAGWLRDHGYAITADAATREFCPDCEPAEREELPNVAPDFVIVLGGDGTLLSTARCVARAEIPILGVNLGSLGFLTEVKQDEIEQALTNLFAMTGLLADLRKAEFLMAQRALQFKHGEVTVKAVPDLVAFYRDAPPLIVDWSMTTAPPLSALITPDELSIVTFPMVTRPPASSAWIPPALSV